MIGYLYHVKFEHDKGKKIMIENEYIIADNIHDVYKKMCEQLDGNEKFKLVSISEIVPVLAQLTPPGTTKEAD